MLGLALKELKAQVLEVASFWVMTRSRLCPWKRFCCSGWRPSGWQAGMLAMSSTGVYQSCRENWGSSSLSHFSRPLFSPSCDVGANFPFKPLYLRLYVPPLGSVSGGFHWCGVEGKWVSKTCSHTYVHKSLKNYSSCALSFLSFLPFNSLPVKWI